MPRLILFNGVTHEFPDDATDETIAQTLMDKQSIDESVGGKYTPPPSSLMEQFMNWWQSGAKPPQPQGYDPRRYPRKGLLGR